MNNTTLQIKFKQRINKLASEDYDNLQCWEIIEAFNKAQLEWCRRQLRGSNLFKDGDEMSKRRVDDLQILLTTLGLTGEDVEYNSDFGYFLSDNFDTVYDPDTGNYLEFKKIETYATQSLPGLCGEPPTPPIPGTPGTDPIPGTDPTYGDPPIIQEATPEVGPVWNDGVPEVLAPHPNETCCLGFVQGETWVKCLADWQAYGPDGTGEWDAEEMQKRCPINECCWQKIWDCDSEQLGCDNDPFVPWPCFSESEEFCECVTDNIQTSDTGASMWDCDTFMDYANNIAEYDWAETVTYPWCNEGPAPTFEVCQEATEGGWECEVGPDIGPVASEDYVCVEAGEVVYGDPPIIDPGTPPIPGTDPTPEIPGTPGTPDGPPIPHPNSDDHCCGPNHKRSMTVYLSEVANTDVILRDPLKNPNFDWGETIVTLQDNQVRIWRSDFYVTEPKLIYYRKPISIEVEGCINPRTNTESFQEVECEFKDDIVELIIDEAVSIVAGDILDVNQFARGSQSAEKNN